MMTAFICLALAMLAAGIAISMLPSASKGNHKITIRHDGNVVTVRSAGSSDISVTFDPSDLHSEEPPMELLPGMEEYAEKEVTLLEEFVDPRTTLERKRQIAQSFNGLKCSFKIKDDSPAESASPIESHAPVASQPTDLYEDVDGCDERILFPDSDEESQDSL